MSAHLVLQQRAYVYKTMFDYNRFSLSFVNVQNIKFEFKTRQGNGINCPLTVYACGLPMVFLKLFLYLYLIRQDESEIKSKT